MNKEVLSCRENLSSSRTEDSQDLRSRRQPLRPNSVRQLDEAVALQKRRVKRLLQNDVDPSNERLRSELLLLNAALRRRKELLGEKSR